MTAHSLSAGTTDIACEDRARMEDIVAADGVRVAARLARPVSASRFTRPGVTKLPVVVLMPGFPRGTGGAALAGNTYPQLADRIATQSGWAALTLHYRGTGP